MITNHAANSSCWAIGTPRANGFHVRKIVWGLLLAQTEKRDGEEVRAATILVEKKYKWRRTIAPELVGE